MMALRLELPECGGSSAPAANWINFSSITRHLPHNFGASLNIATYEKEKRKGFHGHLTYLRDIT